MSMDDWGRTFVCTSHDPVFLIMYDGRYLARNPFLEAPAAALRIAPGGYNTKVSRISPNEPWRVVRTRMRTTGIELPHPTEGAEPSGYFSAATGVTVYLGDAWPADYRGNVFVGEVANNLIYRARLVPNGVGLTALRADPKAEFLASTDIWFRPVQFANGPDGTLYVLDMYRYLIEATDTIPPSIVKHLDVGAGFDKGRCTASCPRVSDGGHGPRLARPRPPNWWRCWSTPTAGTATPPRVCSISDKTTRRWRRSSNWPQGRKALWAGCTPFTLSTA
jgi:putative membrane-bound dehydrogenase-like protein